ncbi:MAG TPA: hypothetical protein PKN75_10925 [Bacteroidia bacterium]|nr:hypothetical protein [Bacteroidia bacterium]
MIQNVNSLSLFIAFALFTKIVSAQEDLDKPGFTISDINLGFGGYSYTELGLSLNDFKKLAPQSELLKTDFSGFNANGGYYNNFYKDALETQTLSEVTIGIARKETEDKKQKLSREFRLGFAYQSGIKVSKYYSHEDVIRFDTLLSTQTGEEFYVDSIKTTNYNMKYTAEQIRLTANILFRLNPFSRWSLFGGAGLNLGISVNPRTEIFYSYTESINAPVQYPVYYESKNKSSRETFRNKLGVAGAGYLIAGVDWRTGNKREFWKKLHISYELRPMVDYNSLPESANFTNTAILQQSSFRYTFN